MTPADRLSKWWTPERCRLYGRLPGGKKRPDRVAELETALAAIYQAARTDEKGEWWTARKYLDERGVFNDDLGSLPRLIEAIAGPLLEGGSDDPR